MAQIQYTATLINGSATVTIPGYDVRPQIDAGDIMIRAGEGVPYAVAAAPSYSAPNSTVVLTGNYQGTSGSVVVTFQRDFVAIGTDNLPLLNLGDIETPTIFSRAMTTIAILFNALIAGTKSFTSILITGGKIHDTTAIVDPADTTKAVRLDAGNVTAGQTRVVTLPDVNLTISAAAATLLDDASIATMRTTLGLVIGTNVQAYDVLLQSLSLLGSAADKFVYTTGANTVAEANVTAVARTLLVATTAAAQRRALVVSGHGYISGFTYANNATDANNDIDIAAGECIDSTNTVMMVGTAMTKRLDAAWAAGTNQGGLDTGTKAANTEYWIHEILKSADSSTDYLLSASRTAPTLPTGYPYFRPIGWCETDASSNIIGFITAELPGGGLDFEWKVPMADVVLANTLGTIARLDALSVPSGIKVRPKGFIQVYDGTSSHFDLTSDPDTTDTAPSASAFSVVATAAVAATTPINCMTDTSRQVRTRSNLSTVDTFRINTHGFLWSRR